jgi:hypothetical protein
LLLLLLLILLHRGLFGSAFWVELKLEEIAGWVL